MSAIRTFTVTVANPGSGNKYYIDGVLQATVNLAEGYTYVFNYPSGHPFKFSTTSDGTHSPGGVEYTTGVTHNSSTQVTIAVASGAPQLYYYCSYHPGMGGAANTVSPDSWGMLKYGHNTWGSQDDVVTTLTGQSATTSLGTVSAFNETGWGADTWGFEGWGGGIVTVLQGLTATTSIGDTSNFAVIKPGWGTLNWGENSWGDVEGSTFTLDGFSLSTTLGTVTPADVIGLTAFPVLQTTLNSLSSVTTDATFTLTGLPLTITPGLLTTDDHSVGLVGLSATTSLGAIVPDNVMGLTGFTPLQTTLGTVTISSDPVTDVTGLSLTSALGTVTASPNSDTTLAGQSLTSALGTLTTVQETNASLVGLGLSATTTLGNAGIVFPGTYGRIVPKTSTGYTKINPV
jgi:hypothetical protein